MDEHLSSREKALKHIRLADHMYSITLPMVKETKLLIAVLENIFLSFSYTMTALLEFERMNKRVPKFANEFESKLTQFQLKTMKNHSVPEKYVSTMLEIRDIIQNHKVSPIEFVRKDQFVICSDAYSMKTITPDTIKNYLLTAKDFFSFTDGVMQS